ncbi:MAG: ATP-binding protein, partial [Candidatus Thermoplasmatota archaeon]|nr:ATP-binding protein [Candidatus Thermoplasmatota archaeon]
FSHIRSRGEPFFYEDSGECDFIIVDKNQVIMALQVTWEMNETTRKREIGGLLKAISEFDLDEGVIVTYDQEEEIEVDGKNINVVPAWKWLLSS